MAIFTAALSVDNEQPWFAVCTKPYQEQVIANFLANNSFRVFNPQFSSSQNRTASGANMVPIFPGYVFVAGGMERRTKILTTPGVYTIVSIGTTPAEIPAIALRTVRSALEYSLHVEPRPYSGTQGISAELTDVKSGPLAGAVGAVDRKADTCDLVVSIDQIAKSVAIRIDPSWLCPEANNAKSYGASQVLARGHSAF